MFKEMIVLATSGNFGTGIIGDLLNKWEQVGFFDYLLPFMLVFALVFGILVKTKIFKDNKMVNGIIALAVALMSLQFGFVSQFFAEIFPRVGIGLIIILGLLITVGLFMDPESRIINYILLGVGVLVFYFVLVQSAGATGWTSGDWLSENWGNILAGVLVVIFVIAMINSQSPKPPLPTHPYKGYWAKE